MMLTTSFVGMWAAFVICLTAVCFGERPGTVSVVDYGARADGQTLNSTAINQAVAACADSGGGTVVIPPGRFVTGPIQLRSNIELRLETGAVLEGSRDINHHEIDGKIRALLSAVDAENVVITGHGVIHGNGTAFMDADTPKQSDHTTGRYSRQGESYCVRADDGPMKMFKRPGSLIFFDNCQSVAIRDVTLKDAPEWTIHIRECDGAEVRGIRILNNLLIPNNDGIHCVTSRNVRIANCDVQAGDDAIAITGLWGKPGAVAENIVVANCTLQSRSSGVRVGYGSNSVRRCTFENLVIHSSNRGLGVFVRDEGSVTDLLFNNIVIETRLHTGWWGNGEPIHVSCIRQKTGTELGQIQNLRFSNILAHSEHGIVLYAAEGSTIRDLSLSGVQLKITESRLNDLYGGNFDLRPAFDDEFSVFSHDIPGLFARGVSGLRIRDFNLAWGEDLSPFFSHGIECEDFSDLEIAGFVGRQAQLKGDGATIALNRGRGVAIRDCRALPGAGTFLAQCDVSGTCLLAGSDLTSGRKAMSPEQSGFVLEGNLLPNKKSKASPNEDQP